MDNGQKIIIGLLLVTITLLIMIKFPIQVEIIKTNCPKFICQNVQCNCNINIKNESCEEEKVFWNYPIYYTNISYVELTENCTDMPFNHCGWQI